MLTPTAAEGLKRWVREAKTRAEAGDDFAAQALAAVVLAQHGWKPEPPDGGEVIDLSRFRYPSKLAA